MKIYLQNSFSESQTQSLVNGKALIEINAFRAFPVNPVFEDDKSNRSDEKSVEQEIA